MDRASRILIGTGHIMRIVLLLFFWLLALLPLLGWLAYSYGRYRYSYLRGLLAAGLTQEEARELLPEGGIAGEVRGYLPSRRIKRSASTGG